MTVTGIPISCARCGDVFDEDPQLTVDCPTCHARAGSPCQRPSGHSGHFMAPHATRRKLAFLRNPCSCVSQWLREHPEDVHHYYEVPA